MHGISPNIWVLKAGQACGLLPARPALCLHRPEAAGPRLQAANVQDIVGNAHDVDQVVHAVDFAGALIDDLDQSLDVLNQKLKHMRTDITAIEARNNSLQVRQRLHRVQLSCPSPAAVPCQRCVHAERLSEGDAAPATTR